MPRVVGIMRLGPPFYWGIAFVISSVSNILKCGPSFSVGDPIFRCLPSTV